MAMKERSTGATMTTDLGMMAQGYFDAWNTHDVEKILSYFTDDCIYEDFGNGKTCNGKAELKEYCHMLFLDYPDLRLEKKSWFSSGNNISYEYIISGTHKHSSNPSIPVTGKRFSVPGVSLIEMRSSKIYHKRTYFNQAASLQQLGLMPAMAAK
ncbi:MAG: DUF1348 family protein [Dehalococcoidales bacterium]|nr:DUF1348 family protein [Dehalococcoidales bacterium]